MERGAGVVSVQTLRAELLWAVAGVEHEDQGLRAREPRARLAQRPESISATRFSTFKTASKRENNFYTISEREKNVGYFWLSIHEQTIFIPNIYIFKAFRRRGYGIKTMKWIEGYQKKIDAKRISLFVFFGNDAALKLYEKSGFTAVRVEMQKT